MKDKILIFLKDDVEIIFMSLGKYKIKKGFLELFKKGLIRER